MQIKALPPSNKQVNILAGVSAAKSYTGNTSGSSRTRSTSPFNNLPKNKNVKANDSNKYFLQTQ